MQGLRLNNGHTLILFGELFRIYQKISNKVRTLYMYVTWELHHQELTQVVGILARARKNRLVHYEGETLWQVTLPLLLNNCMETWSQLQLLIFDWCISFALCEALLLPL